MGTTIVIKCSQSDEQDQQRRRYKVGMDNLVEPFGGLMIMQSRGWERGAAFWK